MLTPIARSFAQPISLDETMPRRFILSCERYRSRESQIATQAKSICGHTLRSGLVERYGGELGLAAERSHMRSFDVQAIEIRTSREKLFEFLKQPENLPKWAHAFRSADARRARLETPAGEVEINLGTEANQS